MGVLLRRGRDDITDEELAPTREIQATESPPPVEFSDKADGQRRGD